MNITLPCLQGELENITLVHWAFNGQNLSSSPARQVVPGPSLFLPSVYYNDSGRYSCHSGGRLLSSLRLMVEEPPQEPNITCFRRSLAKDIFCEWRTSHLMSIRTKAKLWVRKTFVGVNHTEQQCRYYTKSRKFSCRIGGLNDDNTFFLLVSICIVNLAGALRSHTYISTDILLKPDSPVDVVVNAMENNPNQLFVTWRKPPSWGSLFYRLQFQLRYRAEASRIYEVHLLTDLTSYTISDALPGLCHTVQVRAQEEFGLGSWSEWSREAFGTPWTEPRDPESEATSDISEVPFHYEILSTIKPWETPEFPQITNKPAVEDAAAPVPLYTFLIMAATVTVGLALVVGVIVRYRKKWGTSPSGEEKPGSVPPHSLTLLAPEPPLSSSPLLSPPASPFSESSVDSPSILDHSPYDVSNADYFLLP
ncbi:interleukin-6 receptor subunit alpha isoform X2 [Rhineura floridana]|nr:interleukin-6 receptor subunit alpha isoform X2 [Rhineura floridana]